MFSRPHEGRRVQLGRQMVHKCRYILERSFQGEGAGFPQPRGNSKLYRAKPGRLPEEVGGGQTLGALPPAVQPPATTGVLRVLLLHAGDRALPSPRRRQLLRFPHSAQPLGGEQPRAGAPPAPRAPGRRQPQTRALGAPHLAVTAAAGVGPLHPQDLGWAPPLLEGAGGGGGGEQAETWFLPRTQ